MILADKIIRLRKKNGWSQEELAEKMNVSRQAVSKWEGAQTIPDLGKILQLSELFGVTTDYLVKDDMEDEEFTNSNNDSTVKCITLSEANAFLEWRKKASVRIAIATFLCILSPICLLILAAASEIPSFNISENFAVVIGLIVLLMFAAVAVGIYTFCGFQNTPYKFIETEPFETEYGVKGMVREKQKNYYNTYIKYNIIGTCICVLSPIPLFIGAFTENAFFTVMMLSVTMLIAGIGVILFIIAGVRQASTQKLLKEGEYAIKEKDKNKIKETIGLVYWLAATAIFLAWSFITNDWRSSWIVWPIAGVIFAAVMAICNLFIDKKSESSK
ncbi:MAG: helix-turn-helix domain-containing protein [Acutalibacteraceae bacterium]